MTRTSTNAMASIARIALAAMLFAFAAPAPAQDTAPDEDPPQRVARLSYAAGRVSLLPGGSEEWVEARINRPMITGDRLWTDAESRAELALDYSTWWIGDTTSLTVSNVDD